MRIGARSLTPSAQTEGRSDIISFDDDMPPSNRPHSVAGGTGGGDRQASRERTLLPPVQPPFLRTSPARL